ncbi:hypothetical protein SAMN05192534_12352 [Alteribacillus persepolensis]|uniref:Uncharacterized protein n=1 Tax=Alteribacillus persepolensis TaxID=568899 RepID=A0A1G8I9W4_9BACI|nr:hypothetical protein [Alteribacillus persepolensis]SDI15551.1 hypothetical protein SAMN05192534_12352 [Alteribacillus persepolensis]
MNRNDIEQALRDYFWMPKEVARLKQLMDADEIETNVTAQYGMEATLPKAKGQNADKIGKEVARQVDRRQRQIDKLQKKIDFVENGVNKLNNDLERTIMFCMMDGLTQVGISQHLGISEGKVSSMKDSIIHKLYRLQFEGNEQNEGNKEKCVNHAG